MKRKFTKIIIIIVLMIFMLICLTGCGEQKKANQAKESLQKVFNEVYETNKEKDITLKMIVEKLDKRYKIVGYHFIEYEPDPKHPEKQIVKKHSGYIEPKTELTSEDLAKKVKDITHLYVYDNDSGKEFFVRVYNQLNPPMIYADKESIFKK